MERKESPCAHCTRIQNPAGCENKLCKDWRIWFLHRWAEIYRYGQKYGQGKGEINEVEKRGNG